MEKIPENASLIRRKQMTLLVLVVLGLFVISIGLVLLPSGGKVEAPKKESEQNLEVVLTDLTQGAKAEDRWIYKAAGQIETMLGELAQQSTEREELKRKVESLEAMLLASQQARDEGSPEAVEIAALRQAIEELKQAKQMSPTSMESGPPSSRKIANLEFDKAKKSRTFSTKHYLPAGSYVSARMITGVDASVGVSAQSDPRPVEFRVTSKAKSAAFKSKTQEIDIVGCTITGAASGDLSSEKAFIRLLKMTCAKDEETVIETDVVGYAAGLGSAGIRGKVISREGDLVTKSFLAGVVGGIGNSAAQSLQPTPSIFGNNQNPELKDIAGSGLGKGVGNASNRVESYLISRAEQYQPVISVPTTDVELVFEEGVYLDGRGEPQ